MKDQDIATLLPFRGSSYTQRYWRDVNMGARHVMALPHIGYEISGRYMLGITSNIVPFGGF